MQTIEKEKEKLKRLFNVIAQLVSIALKYDGSYASMKSIYGFEENSKSVKEALSNIWNQGIESFLNYCENEQNSLLESINSDTADLGKCVVISVAIIQFIDEKITYNEKIYRKEEDSNGNDLIFASILFDKTPGLYWKIDHLNSDESLENTGIWVNPKLDSKFTVDDRISGKPRPLTNRNSLFHINAILKHMRFFPTSYNVTVKNIVLKSFKARNESSLRVGFGPLCCWNKELFKTESVKVCDRGFEKKGFRINKIIREEELIHRFQKDLWHAARKDIDILFFPEMLGTDGMIDEKYGFSRYWRNTAYEMNKDGLTPPRFLVFPSLWKNRSNIAYSCLSNGMILGGFRKTVPYIHHVKEQGKESYLQEDLEEQNQTELFIVHIPDKGCLSAMICAQFLADDKRNNADVLFSCLGVDLLLVISFSPGERDFVNKLEKFKEYGVSVVWGNCCEAIKTDGNNKKTGIIGAVSVSGTQGISTFGEKASHNCGFHCSSNDSCLFIIDLPLIIPWNKPEIIKVEDIVNVSHSLIKADLEGS